MIIKFSYYNDEDFGLTAFSEIEFSQKEIVENKKNKNEYIIYLVSGSCKFEEYKKVLEGWEHFLKMEYSLESEVKVEL